MAEETKRDGSRLFVIPVDSSKHSERAFSWWLGNIYKPGDKLGIIHVHEPPNYSNESFGVWGKLVFDKDEDYKRQLHKSLEDSKSLVKKFEDKAKEKGIETETILKLNQHGAGQTICNIANEKKADGIIMGSRGLNLIRRTLLGSVSEYVLNHAGTTVTVTPPENAHQYGHVIVPKDDTDLSDIMS